MRLIERHQISNETFGFIARNNFPTRWRRLAAAQFKSVCRTLAINLVFLVKKFVSRHGRIHVVRIHAPRRIKMSMMPGRGINGRHSVRIWRSRSGGRWTSGRSWRWLRRTGRARFRRSSIRRWRLRCRGRRRRGVCARRRCRLFFFGRSAFADVREIRTHSFLSKHYRPIKNIIARRASAFAPFAIDIRGRVIGTDLLAVAIDAAVGSVNTPAALGHARLRRWINVGSLFIHLRIERADLQIRNDGQADPGERERPKNSEEKRN